MQGKQPARARCVRETGNLDKMPPAAPPAAKKTPVRMKNVFSQMMAECPQDVRSLLPCRLDRLRANNTRE